MSVPIKIHKCTPPWVYHWTAKTWADLPYLGTSVIAGTCLEYRLCVRCRSTLAVEVDASGMLVPDMPANDCEPQDAA